VLEGSIVAIQTLRLEYYEGFSRYFTCFGREFKPLIDAAKPNRDCSDSAVAEANYRADRHESVMKPS
jgi:hypothetical protein